MRINWRAAAAPLALMAALLSLPFVAGAVLRSAEPEPLDPSIGLPPPDGGELVVRTGGEGRGEAVRGREGGARRRKGREGGDVERERPARGDGEERDSVDAGLGKQESPPDVAPPATAEAPAPPPLPPATAPPPSPAPAPPPVAPPPSGEGGEPSAGYKEFGP